MRSRRILYPRSPRHVVQVPCQVVRVHDFKLLSNSMENLSAGGMLAGSSFIPAQVGEPLLVSFRLPKWNWWVDADAVVARVIHGRRPTDREPQLGVRFVGLHQEAQNAIAWALSQSPPLPPKVRVGRRDPSRAVQTFAVESGWVRNAFGHMLQRWFPR